LDEVLAVQVIKHVTDYRGVIAGEVCDLVGGGEADSVAVQKSQDIPLTKQGNARTSQATFEGELLSAFAPRAEVCTRLSDPSHTTVHQVANSDVPIDCILVVTLFLKLFHLRQLPPPTHGPWPPTGVHAPDRRVPATIQNKPEADRGRSMFR
jgi:hypothetical protein